jgi:4'-phosphopantetheinyl transferase
MTYQGVRLFVWNLDDGVPARTLSVCEEVRAARMVVPLHAARFAASRTGLRHILGHLLDCEPMELCFALGPHGKPFLPDHAGWQFNLSHSDRLAALGVARGFELGVDIERIRPVSPGLAARFFAPAEAQALDRVAAPLREAAFHACWTRKEATIKAIGTGLATRLDSFAVSAAPDEPARLLWLDGTPDAADRWQMHSFTPAPGFAGAIAAPSRGWDVIRLDPPWHQAEARASR